MTGLTMTRHVALAFFLLLGGAMLPRQAAAHPLGNLSISHYSALHVTQEAIELHYILDLAEIPTFQVLQETGLVPTTGHPSVASYLAQQSQTLQARLQLTLNNQPLALHPMTSEILFPPGAGGLPTLKLGIVYRAPYQALTPQTPYSLHYRDANFPGRTGWQEIIATVDTGITLTQSSVPALDRSRALTDYPTDLLMSPPQTLAATVQFQHAGGTSAATLSVAATPAAHSQPLSRSLAANQQGTPRSPFTTLITVPHLSLSVVAFALAMAAGLGALHALEPGHGKTVVAAYLVGTRGTARHALYLGLIVTLTHTAGVYLLGGITLYASHSIVPEQLYPWLGALSGLMMAGLGGYLLYQRCTDRADGHQHTHAYTQQQARAHQTTYEPAFAHSHAQHQRHDHLHEEPTQAHGHEHVVVPQTHIHHHHDHHHDSHTHHVDTPVSWRALLTLGITGGLIPCPAALVVLLSAVVMQRVGFGLLLIVAFSAGLAAVLIALGLLMVYTRQFMTRFQGDGPLLRRWLPLTSAALVTLFGLVVLVQTLVNAGIV